MKWILYLLLTQNALAYVQLGELYPEQSKAFLQERLKSAKTPFEKWRSFPKAYRAITAELPKTPKPRIGFCAGDPHLENFGFYPHSPPLFTLNDFDDSYTCSLDDDLLRFLIGSKMITKLSTADLVKAYSSKSWPFPESLLALKEKSLRKEKELPKKYKKMLKKKTCKGEFSAASLKKFLGDLVCSRTKFTGGSAGLKRFVVLKGAEGFELKPIESSADLNKAVEVFLGQEFVKDFFSVKIEGKDFLRRPLWAGIEAIDQKDLSEAALNEVLLYESFRLGELHRKTNPTPLTLTSLELDKRAGEILKAWDSVMGHGLVLGNEIKGR